VLASGIGMSSIPIPLASTQQPVWHIPIAVYTVPDSWW